MVGAIGSPAGAVSGPTYVQSVVTIGQTSLSHSFYHPPTDICPTQRQVWDATWSMNVRSDGVYVRTVRLRVYSYDNHELTLGHIYLSGRNTTVTLASGFTIVPALARPWERTFTVNRLIPWRTNNIVGLYVNSYLCNGGGQTMGFELKRA